VIVDIIEVDKNSLIYHKPPSLSWFPVRSHLGLCNRWLSNCNKVSLKEHKKLSLTVKEEEEEMIPVAKELDKYDS
jgi:hypothetical protein